MMVTPLLTAKAWAESGSSTGSQTQQQIYNRMSERENKENKH